MISISKSALELLINRISSIQKSFNTLETEVTDIKTVCEQWMSLCPSAVEKQNNRDVNVTDTANVNKVIHSEWENFEVDGNGFIHINPHGTYLNYLIHDKTNKRDANKPNTCDVSSQTETKDYNDDYLTISNSNLDNHVNEILDSSLKLVPVQPKTVPCVEYVDLTEEESSQIFDLDNYVDELLDSSLENNPVKPVEPITVEYIDLTLDETSETEVIIIKTSTSESKAVLHIDENNFTIDKEGYVWVYTDGSYYQDGRAGVGVWFGFAHPLNLSKSVNVESSGQTEILACIEAIKQAHLNRIKKLCINSDYLEIVELMQGKGKTKSTKHDNEKRELFQANTLLEDIKYRYVKSHSGINGNVQADKLAKTAAQNAKIDGNNNKTALISSKLFNAGFNFDADGYIKVFIKGVRCFNKKNAAIGVWFNHEHKLNLMELVQHSSNLEFDPNGYNGAEVIACNRAIQRSFENGIRLLSIYSDSEHTINNIKRILISVQPYAKRGNKTELCELDRTMKLIKFIKWTYTKGEKGNVEAFIMANKCALILQHPTINIPVNNLATGASTSKEINSITNETNKILDSSIEETNNINTISTEQNSLKRKGPAKRGSRKKKRKLNNETAQIIEN